MQKRGGSSASDSNNAIQEIVPRIKAVTSSIFSLTSTNYRLWALRMEVYLEAHGLWEAITGTETNRKKDQQALSAILNSVSECKFSIGCQENCERELGDNLDTPCGGRSCRSIEDPIVTMGIQKSCDEKR